jgi:hypothetical protein
MFLLPGSDKPTLNHNVYRRDYVPTLPGRAAALDLLRDLARITSLVCPAAGLSA